MGKRYVEVRIPIDSSNVRTVTLIACGDCGAFVFNRSAHDDACPDRTKGA